MTRVDNGCPPSTLPARQLECLETETRRCCGLGSLFAALSLLYVQRKETEMASTVWNLLLAVSLSASPTLEVGTVLTFEGTFEADKGEPAETQKAFNLTFMLSEVGKGGAVILWTLEEQGRGSWSWTEHFGIAQLDSEWQANEATLPALLYERNGRRSVVPVMLPIVSLEKNLAKGLKWDDDELSHEVMGSEKVGDRKTWRVETRNRFGVKRVSWIDKQSPIVVRIRETVFIGPGEEHEMDFELKSQEIMDANELAAQVANFEMLRELRDLLGRESRTLEMTWTDEQLAELRSRLPAIEKKIPRGLLEGVVAEAKRDSSEQKGRAGAISAMRKKALALAMEETPVRDVKDKPFLLDFAAAPITILHFWNYRDAPLEEPYGQVAYLDFLFRQFEKENVQVYGVLVSELLADPTKRRKTIYSAKKLKDFMNLSYPILVDDGDLLKQIGDPRVAGAKLPLFVVLNNTGQIVHYHVGHYKVDRLKGLEDLNRVVTKETASGE